MTNGDRIRQMTDEELANILDNSRDLLSCDKCIYGNKRVMIRGMLICKKRTCVSALKHWLKEEADND